MTMTVQAVPEAIVQPAYCTFPQYDTTYGDVVSGLCDSVEFGPDAEQRFILDLIFARRKSDGKSAAFEINVKVGRQNLKTGVFKQAALGWLFLFAERLVVWSAHEWTTVSEAFQDLEKLCTNYDWLRKQVRSIRHGSGDESIVLLNGARIIFKTRTKGGGRGLSGSKIVLDEAMFLKAQHMGALFPTLSAQPDPQVVYGGSASLEESDVQRDLRDRGRKGEPRLAHIEWMAPDPRIACEYGTSCTHGRGVEGCACDQRKYWIMANPAVTRGRMTLETIESERRAMPPDEFKRERMGWDDDPLSGVSPMDRAAWYRQADKQSRITAESPVAYSIDVAPDKSWTALGVAGFREDGSYHAEMAYHEPGTGWVMDRLMAMTGRREPIVVVLDPVAQAGAFEKELRAKNFVTHAAPQLGKPVRLVAGQRLMMLAGSRDVAQACGALVDDVNNALFWHPDQDPLNKAVEHSRARNVAQAWAWDREGGHDITPLYAVTLAKLGLTLYGKPDTQLRPFILT